MQTSEVVYAGGYRGIANSNYYLSNGYSFYTMSPTGFLYYYSSEWFVNSSGLVQVMDVTGSVNLFPVINLNADVFATGTGTSADPYVIQTN